MNRQLQFHPDVQNDLDEAYAWYESREAGVGGEFRQAVLVALGEVERRPALFAKIKGTIRSAPVTRFPYRIYFRSRSKVIQIVAVVHNRRDARIWTRRG